MAQLHWIFVEDEHVLPTNARQLEALIPGAEGIRFRTGCPEVPGRGTHQVSNLEAALTRPGPGFDVGAQWPKGAILESLLAALQCQLVKSLGDHRDGIGHWRLRRS